MATLRSDFYKKAKGLNGIAAFCLTLGMALGSGSCTQAEPLAPVVSDTPTHRSLVSPLQVWDPINGWQDEGPLYNMPIPAAPVATASGANPFALAEAPLATYNAFQTALEKKQLDLVMLQDSDLFYRQHDGKLFRTEVEDFKALAQDLKGRDVQIVNLPSPHLTGGSPVPTLLLAGLFTVFSIMALRRMSRLQRDRKYQRDDEYIATGADKSVRTTPVPGLEVYTLAVDLKVPADGQIKILEVMPAHHAGSSGYVSVMKQSMVYDVIMPDLAELFPGNVICSKPEYRSLPDIGETFGHMAAETGGAIVFPGFDNPHKKHYVPLTRTEILFAQSQADYRIINADIGFITACDNKALQQQIVEQHTVTRDAFAPGVVLPTAYEPGMADRIVTALGTHDYYVLKPVDQSQGNGVRIVPHDDLDRQLKEQFLYGNNRQAPRPGVDYWETNIAPVFVAQPLVNSEPLPVYDRDGYTTHPERRYDGTLRVFLTLYRDGPDRDFQTKIHDGYWKLPKKAAKADKDISSTVSFSPARTERGLLSRLFGGSKIISSAMRDEQRELVYPQLEKAMPVFMKNLMAQRAYDRIAAGLQANDPVRVGTALMLACDPQYYVSDAVRPVARNACAYPAEFYDRMAAIMLESHPDEPAAVYLRSLKEQQNRYVPRQWRAGMRDAVDRWQDAHNVREPARTMDVLSHVLHDFGI